MLPRRGLQGTLEPHLEDLSARFMLKMLGPGEVLLFDVEVLDVIPRSSWWVFSRYQW